MSKGSNKWLILFFVAVGMGVCVFIIQLFVAKNITEKVNQSRNGFMHCKNEKYMILLIDQSRHFTENDLAEVEKSITENQAEIVASCYLAIDEEVLIQSSNDEIKGSEKELERSVYAISEQYCMFHSLNMICGTNNLYQGINEDGVVISKDLAWEMYGSTDVLKKKLLIQDKLYTILGVYDMDDYHVARMCETAPIYVRYDYFISDNNEEIGKDIELNLSSYEFIASNMMDGQYIVKDEEREKFLTIDMNQRFQYKNRLFWAKDLRSLIVSQNVLHIPFWENECRVYSLYLSVLYSCCLLIYILSIGVALIGLNRFLREIRNKNEGMKKNDRN